MAILNMSGPYSLTEEKIDEVITKESAGNYALGKVDPADSKFIIDYVGRSDNDVNKRLKEWVGKYKKFKYSYATSIKAAFEKECNNYHDFGGKEKLDNKKHPDRPNGKDWQCPQCDELEE